MANSTDPDETSRSAASHLGLHYLLRPVSSNTYGKYGNETGKFSTDAVVQLETNPLSCTLQNEII